MIASGGPSDSSVTYLPHWGPLQRWLHRWCRRSRRVNTWVAAWEMRRGRSELISLPQYMALCPTGQCNASCGFCSVTLNRTGIIKRQLPLARLRQFLEPVAHTIRMFGIEGNGEPTLYDDFDELLELLTRNGATFYLITNASRLNPERTELLLTSGVNSVNVSLNAATAETHAEVMKFKHWPEVVENIRHLTTASRGREVLVSVSLVVDRDNVHEVTDFIRLADRDLQVDRIHIRPLSEIATDQGVVEDLRDLVPYEYEVNDCVARVTDLLATEPPRAEVRFDAATFRAFRPNPVAGAAQPRRYEEAVLAPRRREWTLRDETVRCEWLLDGLQLEAAAATPGPFLESGWIAVRGREGHRFRAELTTRVGRLGIALENREGQVVASCKHDEVATRTWEAQVTPAWGDAIRVVVGAETPELQARIDFERLWTAPLPRPEGGVFIPESRQWETPTPEARVAWQDDLVEISYDGVQGPYLLKSFSVPCRKHERLRLPLKVHVESGRLGLGTLDESAQSWTHTFEFDAADGDRVLELNTGENERYQLVLYSAASEQLSARVDFARARWGETTAQSVAPTSTPPKSSSQQEQALATEPSRQEAQASESGEVTGSNAVPEVPAAGRKRKFYCQKPWTDLNNFSVDGRMDVCCITTGASQERYQLGNLLQQDFQSVWNGERAQEFRRTVNSSEPLPPCQRCPMAYAYQGPMFHPEQTWNRVRRLLGFRLPWRWARAVFVVPGLALYAPLHAWWFRRFKR